ncbi:MAG: hypothetical protein JSV27_06545 [Candidatus Bathyarchaeota archaeon]|nr:MAG: hypothetical protein JSV27_06545 [Candidatus Bathyarchaeota archaeon]
MGKLYKTIKIGVIVAWSGGLETAGLVFEEIVEPDINAYMAKLPRAQRVDIGCFGVYGVAFLNFGAGSVSRMVGLDQTYPSVLR